MWLNIKSGYSFKQVYGHLDKIAQKCRTLCDQEGIKHPYGGIADLGNTFAHVPWKKACEKADIKPIYGVQLPVVEDLNTKERRYPFNWMTFFARNAEGLQEIYRLVDLSFQQFYYRQRISYDQLNKISLNVFVLSGIAPRWDLIKIGILKELSPSTPKSKREHVPAAPIACIDNYYVNVGDEIVYEPFADERLREKKTTPIHILTKNEWRIEYPKPKDKNALNTLLFTAKMCNVELPHAGMVKYKGSDTIISWCRKGMDERRVAFKQEYLSRYQREMKLIKEKDYADYFLVVADLIRYAKKHMTVGGGRGSSAGSLVCYLMGITEVDPIKNGLFFERFIDINRHDLPDIDIDFQDDKRHMILKYLQKKYGKDSVAQVCNINRFKPKSAINKFAQALSVPIDDAIELKDSVIERKPGDERANKCLADTFTETEVGKEFIEKYPRMRVVEAIENHPSHMGVHAAGLLVSNQNITNFCGVNSRDKKRVGMLDKKDAEAVGLLKIDALGLTTLTIIASVCDQIGKPYEWIHTIPLDDDFIFDIFNEQRYTGIFQFEGGAIQKLAKAMRVDNIEDISALCALCRPGPLQSGGAWDFIHAKNGDEEIEHATTHHAFIEATKNTYGVLVYQEQMLEICREYGLLSWEDTSELRKITSKTKGKESFDKYRKIFLKGAIKNGDDEESALNVWNLMITFGKYAFNKSHSVSYAVISYLCAYFKYHHPVEFTLACLKHTDSDRSALKILRDAVEHDGIEYEYFDEDLSQSDWSIQSGVLYGGFNSLPGLGIKKSQQAVKLRNAMDEYPAGMGRIIKKADSPFKYLYPADEIYGDYYTDPSLFGLKGVVTRINEVDNDGEYTIIGCMISKKIRNANEQDFVAKRNGKYLEGDTTWLNIVVEDDTGSIMCKIKKEYYRKLGKSIAENGKDEKDWYLIYGNKINRWELLFVENIKRITR